MRLSDPPPGRRSELFAWYVSEWEVLRGAPINWKWLMGEISKRGLLDRNGKAPKLQTAKQTWHRCNKEMKKREASKVVPTPPRRQSPEPPRLSVVSTHRFPPAKIKE